MSNEVSKELVIGVKEYLKQGAYGFTHKKTLIQIAFFFPNTAIRTIRKAIEKIKQVHKIPVATGGKGNEGYFIPDPNSELDKKMAWKCYKKLMKQNGKIYLSALPLKKFRPTDQMAFKDSE